MVVDGATQHGGAGEDGKSLKLVVGEGPKPGTWWTLDGKSLKAPVAMPSKLRTMDGGAEWTAAADWSLRRKRRSLLRVHGWRRRKKLDARRNRRSAVVVTCSSRGFKGFEVNKGPARKSLDRAAECKEPQDHPRSAACPGDREGKRGKVQRDATGSHVHELPLSAYAAYDAGTLDTCTGRYLVSDAIHGRVSRTRGREVRVEHGRGQRR